MSGVFISFDVNVFIWKFILKKDYLYHFCNKQFAYLLAFNTHDVTTFCKYLFFVKTGFHAIDSLYTSSRLKLLCFFFIAVLFWSKSDGLDLETD